MAAISLVSLCLATNLAAQESPRLSIEPGGPGTVHIEWPIGMGLYSLEQLSALNGVDQWLPISQPAQVRSKNFQLEVPATDEARFYRLRLAAEPDPGVAPDPAAIAPLYPPNADQSFVEGTAFLYSGASPVQFGVEPGTISGTRASVVRGRIRTRDGTPLGGVHVQVLDHPEFGFTYTRADGMYDLSVNGAQLYTLDFQLRGYCPAQRQVEAPAADFRSLADLHLVRMDPVSTPVVFGTNAPLQVALSSTNTDLAGTRSATLLFPPGTCVSLFLPNGATQDCRGLTVRATEFTVGPDGPKAMPGTLPPSSAYTYAVELSSDEAVAAGASSIQFNQYIHVYVDNFLGMPAGALVPSGYYDRRLSAWVPQANGVVIKILGSEGGIAQLDVNGDGLRDDSQALADAAFTTAELQHLAATYPAGKTLWRMPVSHFTAWDFNCPTNPEQKDKPNKPGQKPTGNPRDKVDGLGSVNLASQVFEETIPLVGVPMDLHYSSARVPGYRVNAELHIPLIGETVFPELQKVEVEMEVAGRFRQFEYPPVAKLTADFGWDGYDAYGRWVYGSRLAHVALGYAYPQIYGGHESLAQGGISTIGYGPPLFGNYGQFTSTIAHNEVSEQIRIQFDHLLTVPDHRRLGMGGWSLSPHHVYDPTAKILYRGDGSIDSAESYVGLTSDVSFDGREARKIASAPDGSLFLVDSDNAILRMSPEGLLTYVTASRTPEPGFVMGYQGSFRAQEGLPAIRVRFNSDCRNLAAGPDGSVYYRTAFEILRITPDGVLHVVLGTLAPLTFGDDGTLARDSYLSGSGEGSGLAIGPDGTVYYSDTVDLNAKRFDLLRKIAPDGRLYTLAGRGGRRSNEEGVNPNQPVGQGEPAINARTDAIRQVEVGPDGSVYYSDANYSLQRITPGGILQLAMYGRPLYGESEGELAVGRKNPAQGNARVPAVQNFKIGADGSVYVHATQGGTTGSLLWKIDGAGYLQRLAGKPSAPYNFGLPPTEANMGDIIDFAVDRAGGISVITRGLGSVGPWSIQRIGPALPGFGGAELRVPSLDGGELYVFNAHGLHLRTMETLTGNTNWLFTYGANNLLSQIHDGQGRVTTIERNATGAPSGIVGPSGQRTVLAVDANGFLSAVTDPAGGAATLDYATGGLLTSIRGPRGNTYQAAYDEKGRVVQLTDPASGALRISHEYTSGNDFSTVTDLPAGGREVRDLKLLATGDSTISTLSADGTVNSELRMAAGGSVFTDPDGTVTTWHRTGDPRFPTQTRVLDSLTVVFPGGLRTALSLSRSATLETANDPLSAESLESLLNVNGEIYKRRYDAKNRQFIATTPEGRITTQYLDVRGRVTQFQAGNDSPLEYRYNDAGRLSAMTYGPSENKRMIGFGFNDRGLVGQITNAMGNTFQITYDPADRVASFTLLDGSVAGFEHDAEHHLVGVTPPGRPKHTFEYNSRGLLSKYTPPVVSTDDSIAYDYDAGRNLTNVSFPDGQKVVLARDPAGRVSNLKLGDGPVLDYGYNPATGQLTSAASSSGENMIMDYRGWLQVQTRWSGIVEGEISLQFDANLRPIVETINGSSLNYAYDRDGALTGAGELIVARDPQSGRIKTCITGVVREEFAYDEQGLLTNQVVVVAGTNLLSTSLRYDLLNRINHRTETLSGVTHGYEYFYDAGGRLSEVRRDGTPLVGYTYDANGNRLSRNDEVAAYDAQDRLMSYAGANFEWSRNGHWVSRTVGGQPSLYSYDLSGALISVSMPGQSVDYVLDPRGRRVGRKINGALERGWLWRGSRIVAEVNDASVVTKRFVYSDESVVTPALMIVGTTSYRILSDERGSVRGVIDIVTGNIAQALEYDEFGRVLSDSAPGFQPFGYAGGLYDPATGLVRFGDRDYEAHTGQWTARDPILFSGRQYSLYSYVRNNPMNLVDPSGTGPFNKTPKDYEDRFSPHQRRILDEAGTKISRNRELADLEYQIRLHTRLTDQDLKFIKDSAKEVAEDASGVFERARVGVLDVAMDLGEAGSEITHAVVEEMTGDGLRKSEAAAKRAGNIQGPGSQQQPFNPFKW